MFSLGKNDKVNTLEMVKISHKNSLQAIADKELRQSAITHEGESCLNTCSNWRPYYMVHVLIKKTKPTSGCSVSRLLLGTLT